MHMYLLRLLLLLVLLLLLLLLRLPCVENAIQSSASDVCAIGNRQTKARGADAPSWAACHESTRPHLWQ